MTERKVHVALIATLALDNETKRRAKTRYWIKRWKQRDVFAEIVQELRMEGTASFKGMLRMEYSAFFIWTLYICSIKLSWNWENIGKRKTNSYFTFSFNWWNSQMACISVSGIVLSCFLYCDFCLWSIESACWKRIFRNPVYWEGVEEHY